MNELTPPVSALDPNNQWNSVINDIRLAPRNGGGMVEYSATFTLLRPLDASSASGVLWYEVPNRGNSPLNPRPSADALAAGYILLSSGWQGDLAPRAGLETITVPAARNPDGSPITGPVLYRIANVRGQNASLQAGMRGSLYSASDLGDARSLGFVVAPSEELRVLGPKGYANAVRERVGDRPVFLSFDIDFLDPAFAPGTGTPEVAGFSTAEAVAFLRALRGLELVGSDVVEVAPPYDGPGQPTALAAANVALDLLALYALSR